MNTAWGLGLVVRPALGGYLAQPAEKYTQTFSKESVFGRFPYLLPCLGVSLFAAIVLISCIWMPETMHKHKNPNKDIRIVKGLESDLDTPRKKSLLQNWPWMSTMVSYCFFSLYDTAYNEILSLWAVSDRKYGGLSFSSEDIGAVLSVAGSHISLGPSISGTSHFVAGCFCSFYSYCQYLSLYDILIWSQTFFRSLLCSHDEKYCCNQCQHRNFPSPEQCCASRTKRHCQWYSNNRHVVFQGNCANRGRHPILVGAETSGQHLLPR